MTTANGRDPEIARLRAELDQLRIEIKEELGFIGEHIHEFAGQLAIAGLGKLATFARALADQLFRFRERHRPNRGPREDL
jgi:HPt (histidine-containing phosphotransfer) domain-containing protein